MAVSTAGIRYWNTDYPPSGVPQELRTQVRAEKSYLQISLLVWELLPGYGNTISGGYRPLGRPGLATAKPLWNAVCALDFRVERYQPLFACVEVWHESRFYHLSHR